MAEFVQMNMGKGTTLVEVVEKGEVSENFAGHLCRGLSYAGRKSACQN